MFEFEEQEPLGKGLYEVYYTCSSNIMQDINSFTDIFDRIFSSKGSSKFRSRYRSDLKIIVTGEKGKFNVLDPEKVLKSVLENSVASINRVMDYEDSQVGFSLADDTELRIYTIGEGRDSHGSRSLKYHSTRDQTSHNWVSFELFRGFWL